MTKAKKYSIVFFLILATLIPVAEKVIHDFGHFKAEHCTEKNVHIHSHEHSCKSCDVDLNTHLLAEAQTCAVVVSESCFSYLIPAVLDPSAEKTLALPARAPPVV